MQEINTSLSLNPIGLNQWISVILIAVLIAFLFRGFVFEPVYVEGKSMENTLSASHRILLFKSVYYFHPPKRKDIIVLKYKEGIVSQMPIIKDIPIIKKSITSFNEIDYLKRVIAVPGDILEIKNDGFVYINGDKIDEPYAKDQGSTYTKALKAPLEIPSGFVFVMGDNRTHSTDSRQFGLVKYDRIKGKAILRVWPLNKFGAIK